MKYVRTKDGIIELKDIENAKQFKDLEIIKSANTIEELCDEFVVVSYSTNKVMYQTKDYNYFWSIAKKSYINHSTIRNEHYGAIWTDKGLIYVAKMNEKGELELL